MRQAAKIWNRAVRERRNIVVLFDIRDGLAWGYVNTIGGFDEFAQGFKSLTKQCGPYERIETSSIPGFPPPKGLV
jgi:hypothetical protein